MQGQKVKKNAICYDKTQNVNFWGKPPLFKKKLKQQHVNNKKQYQKKVEQQLNSSAMMYW